MRRSLLASSLAALVAFAACSSSETNETNETGASAASSSASASSSSSTSSSGGGGGATTASSSSTGAPDGGDPIGGDRPVDVFTPSTYDGTTPLPLVLLLHGYILTGAQEEAYMQLQPLAESRGFIYAHPDGTKNSLGIQWWNATDACCNYDQSTTDDSGYLESVIQQIEQRYAVDPKQVYLVGHSNGGFMSYRMACDHADTIAAIASLAGETWKDTSKCAPSEGVAVLQIQGDMDEVIAYDGGPNFGGTYPGAMETCEDWVAYNGCADTPVAGASLDLVSTIAGDETAPQSWSMGCKPNGSVELWTMHGGTHIPALSPTFASDVIDFLFAHPKQ